MERYRHTQIGWLTIGITVIVSLAVFPTLGRADVSGPVIVVCAVVAFVLTSFSTMTIAIDEKHLEVRLGVGFIRKRIYGQEIPLDEITDLSLVDSLPAVRVRTNGFALGGTLRGHFRLDGLGDGQLFIERNRPPYVIVRTPDDFVVVNFTDPRRTQTVYVELMKYVQAPRSVVDHP